MEWLTSNSMLMTERSIDFLWTKQRTILNNISNAETPGYKAQYVTFEETLERNIRSAAGAAKPRASIREALEESGPMVRTAASESTRLDENGVNVTEQGVELARNTFQLQYALQSINSDFTILRNAIKGQ